MRSRTGSLTQALGPSFGDRLWASSVVHGRVSTTTAHTRAAAAIVPMVTMTTWLALTSEHLERPLAAALYWSYLIAVSAGGGPLTRCAPSCPANVLQVGSASHVVEVAGKAET